MATASGGALRAAIDAAVVLVSNLHPHLSTADATQLREAWDRVDAELRVSECAPASDTELLDYLQDLITRSDEDPGSCEAEIACGDAVMEAGGTLRDAIAAARRAAPAAEAPVRG